MPAGLAATFIPSPTAESTLLASLGTPPSAPIQDVIAVNPQGDSPWLILAVIVQALIIVGAGIMLVRSARRR